MLAVTLLASGCSLVFVTPLPPKYAPGDRATCTDSYAAPDADMALMFLNILGAAVVVDNTTSNRSTATSASIGGGFLSAIVHVSSAVWGYQQVSRCRRAIAVDQAPPPLGPLPIRLHPLPEDAAAPPPVVVPARRARQQQDDDDPDVPRPKFPTAGPMGNPPSDL